MSLWLPKSGRLPPVLSIDQELLAWADQDDSETTSRPYRELSTEHWRDIVADAKPGFVDVIVGNDVALHWVQVPPLSVSSFAELRAVAQARCVHLYGGATHEWRIAADWQAKHPFVCMALPQHVVTPIERQLADFRLTVRWHSAWSVLTCKASNCFPSDRWSAVRTPARVMLWRCIEGEVDCIASWATGAQEGTSETAAGAIQRMRVEMARSGGQQQDESLHWLDFSADRVLSSEELPDIVPVRFPPAIPAFTRTGCGEAHAALALRALLGSLNA